MLIIIKILLFVIVYNIITIKQYNDKYDKLFNEANTIKEKIMIYFNYHYIKELINNTNNISKNTSGFSKIVPINKYLTFTINEFDNSNNLEFSFNYIETKMNYLFQKIDTEITYLTIDQKNYLRAYYIINLQQIIIYCDYFVTNYDINADTYSYDLHFINFYINIILLKYVKDSYYKLPLSITSKILEYDALIKNLNSMDLYNNPNIDLTNLKLAYNTFRLYIKSLQDKKIKEEEFLMDIDEDSHLNNMYLNMMKKSSSYKHPVINSDDDSIMVDESGDNKHMINGSDETYFMGFDESNINNSLFKDPFLNIDDNEEEILVNSNSNSRLLNKK